MLRTLRLLIPALIPSWNFFDVIARSPRVEYAHTETPGPAAAWREFRPRPQRLGFPGSMVRLVWNARWNETLFVVSCAELLLADPTAHSEDEVFRRIAADVCDEGDTAGWLRFRIVLVDDRGAAVNREIAFVAEPRRLADIPVR